MQPEPATSPIVTGFQTDWQLICNHSKLEIEFLSPRVKYSLLMPKLIILWQLRDVLARKNPEVFLFEQKIKPTMPEVIINGPVGRLEARYHHNKTTDSPIAILLHPHPQFGGTMNNQTIYNLYYSFVDRGFSVLRFNFRSVGRSQGVFDNGPGELADAASCLDWLQTQNPDSHTCWIAGTSFGAWIAMQLLMRRPEIDGFISIAPPANHYDFSFLAPCPSSGLIVNGSSDRVVPSGSVEDLVGRLKTQKGIKITHDVIEDANHFFEGKMDLLMDSINDYLDSRLGAAPTYMIESDR